MFGKQGVRKYDEKKETERSCNRWKSSITVSHTETGWDSATDHFWISWIWEWTIGVCKIKVDFLTFTYYFEIWICYFSLNSIFFQNLHKWKHGVSINNICKLNYGNTFSNFFIFSLQYLVKWHLSIDRCVVITWYITLKQFKFVDIKDDTFISTYTSNIIIC
jgi:hypothetical protein